MSQTDDEANVLQNGYQTSLIGDSYQPIPEKGMQNEAPIFVPPSGGTGARTIQVKEIISKAEKK
jgi:hypothetical protein